MGLPVSCTLLALCWLYLVRVAFPLSNAKLPGGKDEVGRQLRGLGRISFEEKLVLLVFSATALAWILRPFLLNPYLPALDDTIIALGGALAMFLLPARRIEKFQLPRLLDWQAAVKIPWGIILLFGGGL
ncbi:anion permease, partial [Arthrospira platensis SPKY1]|nr:anion permease [Arthrospira platensis SPKY1]